MFHGLALIVVMSRFSFQLPEYFYLPLKIKHVESEGHAVAFDVDGMTRSMEYYTFIETGTS